MNDLLTSHIEDLESLIRIWRKYVTGHNTPDNMGRDTGYIAGLKLCASQLDETITRLRMSMED